MIKYIKGNESKYLKLLIITVVGFLMLITFKNYKDNHHQCVRIGKYEYSESLPGEE